MASDLRHRIESRPTISLRFVSYHPLLFYIQQPEINTITNLEIFDYPTQIYRRKHKMSAFATTTNTNPRSEFESQRAELVREIALVRPLISHHLDMLVANKNWQLNRAWNQSSNT